MNKLCGALGLCMRAGKAVLGTELVADAVRKHKVALVVIASDTGKSAERKIVQFSGAGINRCKRVNITKKEMSAAVGVSREVGVIGIPQDFVNIVLASM